MNFKTTIILLIALVIAGSALLFRGRTSEEPTITNFATHKLLDVSPESVSQITVSATAGDSIAFEKTNGDWSLTQPVTGKAEKFAVDDLVRTIVLLDSHGQVATETTGVDKPRYTIKFTADGKSHDIAVGDASAVGENVYVKLDSSTKADLVPASLIEQLSKPVVAYRQTKLAPDSIEQIEQVTLARPDRTISLAKTNGVWAITAPQQMPADASAVNDILTAITSLSAEDFVAETVDPTALGTARLSISYVTASAPVIAPSTTPATQPTTAPTSPSTTAPAARTITLGRFADISRKSVLATSSAIPSLVKVSATSLEAFNKSPLDLRDKQVLLLDTSSIQQVSLTVNSAATTQPTTRPASQSKMELSRRPAVPVGPPMPMPSTTQSATAPSSAPAPQPVLSKWMETAKPQVQIDDAVMDSLMATISPLRAEKFVEQLPVVLQPRATYILSLSSPANGPMPAVVRELRVLDFGPDSPLLATYNGLVFEAPKPLLTALSAKFVKE